MLRNYLVVAWRALARHRLYSAINVAGLAVGLASCIVISLYVLDQLLYDAWLPDAERIYRVESAFAVPGREVIRSATSPAPVMETLSAHFESIVAAVRLLRTEPVVERGTLIANEQVLYADPGFFDVFDLPLVRGERHTALADASSIVVTESMARKWFGTDDAVGQVLSVTRIGKTRDLRVSGVLRDLPHNSHLRLDFLARLDPAELDGGSEVGQWGNAPVYTYVKLDRVAALPALLAGMPGYAERWLPDLTLGTTTFALSEILQLRLVNARDIHLHSSVDNQLAATGDFRMVSTVGVIALLILLIASINYMNLTTARAGQREREIAMRKVLGASRRQIVVQFLGESTLVAVLALTLALALVELSVPAFNAFLGTRLEVDYLGSRSLLPQAASLVVVVGVLGGLYPAFYLSRFQPAAALKSSRSARGSDASARVRAALVPIQFAIMITLVVSTAVVYVQTGYSRSLDLGFDREKLLLVRDLDRAIVAPRSEALAREVERLPAIVGVARASHVPGDESSINAMVERPDQRGAQAGLLESSAIDVDFFELMRIPMLAGRALSATTARDDATRDTPEKARSVAERGINIVIDDRARARLGFASPAAAVGQAVQVMQPDAMAATIVGVTAGFRFRSTRFASLPTVFLHDTGAFSRLVVRYTGEGPAAMAAVEGAWRRVLPDVPFRGEFLDTVVAAQYAEEETRARIFAIFAALAVVIACLGLFGMASFAAERRVKEIGIRKVLGASATRIVLLLLRQFSVPVLVANLAAWPLAYWLMREWLNGFAVRVELSPWFFLGAGALALLVAWGTVGGHAYRVARSSPVEALRYE